MLLWQQRLMKKDKGLIMLNTVYILARNLWDDESFHYVSVDRNAYGDVTIDVKKEPTINSSSTIVSLDLDRVQAFRLANQILEALVAYPDDQVERIGKNLDCACKNRYENGD